MEFQFYIIAQAKTSRYARRGGKLTEPGTVRVAKNRPAVDSDEVAVKMSLELPEGLFNRPSLSARIAVQDDSAPIEITAEALSNIESVIRDQTGLEVRVLQEEEGS